MSRPRRPRRRRGEGAHRTRVAISRRAWRLRRSWARMIRRIYEVDPLVCPRCGDELKVVSVIMDPVVVDRILAHRAQKGLDDLFEARAPPGG